LLRVELDRLTLRVVPAILVLRLALDLNPLDTGGMIARLGILVALSALAMFFFRVLHPKRGALAHWRIREKRGVIVGSYKLWYAALVVLPLALAVLPFLGYLYSVFTLSFMYFYTLWMIVALVFARALALRWLLLVRRRLTYEAAMERRQEEREAKRAGALEAAEEGGFGTHGVDEPEVDLEALSDDSRELVNVATIGAGLVFVFLIWSPLLPAMRIFDDVHLWYQTLMVDGEETLVPITLADLGLALLYAIGVGILATRLPALLEIILLRRFDVSAGSRYAVVTLTNYSIIVIGVLLVFNAVGAQWSQLQWLVAALGVGIGFGLQEIVANFISGLIILFERPIRVGDMVTVGDTDGLVTKIRIRATTIRNFDRKELLVPNKEFITGRLLNWSLSDQVTRLVVVVGVAYGSDVDKAHALMREAAEENKQVLDDPAPIVSFEGFGDNSLTLLLRAFIDDLDYRVPTITALHKSINRKFEAAGITIAFPQRDLHLDTNGPLRVSIENSRQRRPEGG
jgi:potassium efflux system protein